MKDLEKINTQSIVFKDQEDIDLHSAILNLKEEIKSMTPEDGFNSPRDYNLVKDVNIKSSILEKWIDAMKERHPDYKLEQ
jgi:hypothetical protein